MKTMKSKLVWLAAALAIASISTPIIRGSGSPEGKPVKDKIMNENTYVLEILGLGATLDKYRQGELWKALQNGDQFSSVRESDPRKYKWSAMDKGGTAGGRQCSTLENGARHTVSYWAAPVFNAEPPLSGPYADRPELPRAGLIQATAITGMVGYLFVTGARKFSERPDNILNEVFEFFDKNPDIPYIILTSSDGVDTRDTLDPSDNSTGFKDGYYVPEMPDSSVLFVLARRERVERLRPFAFEDLRDRDHMTDVLNKHGIGRRLFLTHLELETSVPVPEGKLAGVGRQPRIDEWLPAAAKFAQRDDIRGRGWPSMRDVVTFNRHHPPKEWQPTPWFPVPWSIEQLEDFDRLPSLGFIHRPVFVPMIDAQGKPIKKPEERQALLHKGWQQALAALPSAQRSPGPTRIIASTGGKVRQQLDLHGLLRRILDAGGPAFDPARHDRLIDMDRRLGNTGASTLFMGMAIGVLSGHKDGSTSAAINLRDPNEASIVFVTPASEEARKLHHRWGEDKTTPLIDPANYINAPTY